MNLSDRNSRLILVITGIGLFGYLFKIILGIIQDSFSTIYLGPFPFGAEQIFSSTLLANALLIFIIGICYCYQELHNYSNNVGINAKKHLIRSDKYYRLLLKVSFTSFIMTILLLFILFFLIPLLLTRIKISITILIIFCLVIIFKSNKDTYLKVFNWFINYENYKAQSLVIFAWLIFIPTSMLLGINQNLDTKFEISFDGNNKPKLFFLFKDHVPDQMPDKFTIRIVTNLEERELVLNKNQFKSSIQKVIKNNDNSLPINTQYFDKNPVLIDKSEYLFKKNLELPILKGKQGYVEIQFKNKEIASATRKYYLRNDFYLQDGKYIFNQGKFDVNLK